MNIRSWLRFSGLAALWGGVLGAVDSILLAAAFYNHAWSQESAPGWAHGLVGLVGQAFSFAQPEVVYRTYGRILLVAQVLFLLGAVGLEACVVLRSGKRGGWGFRLVVAGLVMSILGNLADYWISPVPIGHTFLVIGFVIGVELGALVYLVGALMLAGQLMADRLLSTGLAWLLGLAPAVGLLLSIWGVRQIPGGFFLPVSLSWAATGMFLWIAQSRPLPIADTHTRAGSE
jgi:hypothetical protein